MAQLNIIESPLQSGRDVFDLMSTDCDEDWESVATWLRAPRLSAGGWNRCTYMAADAGTVAARRQVQRCIEQCEDHTGDGGYCSSLAERARGEDGAQDEALQTELRKAVAVASEAYTETGRSLRDELLVRAPEQDSVGRERYALHSREFLGASVDLEETYA